MLHGRACMVIVVGLLLIFYIYEFYAMLPNNVCVSVGLFTLIQFCMQDITQSDLTLFGGIYFGRSDQFYET